MARLNKSDDPYLGLNEPDPYLDLNSEVEIAPKKRVKTGPVLAEEDTEKPRPKKDALNGFDPSILRSVVSAINGLDKRLESASAKPAVNVAAPNVKVEAPEVTIKTPKKWRIRVTERDHENRIKEMTIDAVD